MKTHANLYYAPKENGNRYVNYQMEIEPMTETKPKGWPKFVECSCSIGFVAENGCQCGAWWANNSITLCHKAHTAHVAELEQRVKVLEETLKKVKESFIFLKIVNDTEIKSIDEAISQGGKESNDG